MPEEKKVVVFDFDRTITSTDTIKFLLISLLVVRPLRIIGAIFFFLRFGVKGLFVSEKKHLLIGYLLKNRKIKSVNRSLWLFEAIVQRFIRHDIRKVLSEYLRQNAMVVIGTASPDFAIQYIFKHQQAVIVGTEYEKKEERYFVHRFVSAEKNSAASNRY